MSTVTRIKMFLLVLPKTDSVDGALEEEDDLTTASESGRIISLLRLKMKKVKNVYMLIQR